LVSASLFLMVDSGTWTNPKMTFSLKDVKVHEISMRNMSCQQPFRNPTQLPGALLRA
jgi:hypothetical protein